MNDINKIIEENKGRYLSELMEFLKIPSISADPAYKDEVRRAAQFVSEKLKNAGADNIEIMETKGHPIVYGEKLISPDLPTVLVYGHYDVQPPDPIELWDSPPFEPVIKETDLHPNGAIFARGACDDKGQLYMHIKAFEIMMQNGGLPCNLKFMLEGEEEVGSENLGPFCEENKELLSCDVVLLSDTSIIDNNTPSITVGLRGLAYMEVEVRGPIKDLHSGVYGGAVANPANVLCDIISKLKDENNHITIPGFYNDVVIVSEDERALMNEAPFNLKSYKEGLSINKVEGEKGFTTLERTSIRPSLDVNGIWSGYIGEGAKTVLPSKAFAKISMRLVPNQNPNTISKLFEDYFRSLAPDSVEIIVTPHHGGFPVVTPTDTLEYKAASMAMEKTFGSTAIPQRSGGSIPIIPLFEKVLGVKSVMMGFGLNTDDIHSPNEHFGLFNYFKGIETIPYFYENYSKLKTT